MDEFELQKLNSHSNFAMPIELFSRKICHIVDWR